MVGEPVAVHAGRMIQRLTSASPGTLAAATAIMVGMIGALLLRGVVISVVSGLVLGCAVLIDASTDLPKAES